MHVCVLGGRDRGWFQRRYESCGFAAQYIPHTDRLATGVVRGPDIFNSLFMECLVWPRKGTQDQGKDAALREIRAFY